MELPTSRRPRPWMVMVRGYKLLADEMLPVERLPSGRDDFLKLCPGKGLPHTKTIIVASSNKQPLFEIASFVAML